MPPVRTHGAPMERHRMVDTRQMTGSGNGRGRRRVGVDIGGTFTDLLIQDETTGMVRLARTPTMPADLWQGIRSGLDEAAVDPATIEMLITTARRSG
jgi:hypothetical protein